MVEKAVPFTLTDSKVIERVVSTEHVDINHMVLNRGDALPEHNANSHVQMIVVRGTITLRLDQQEPHAYEAGQIIAIPFGTRMNVANAHEPVAEIFVVKAPSPASMA